MKVSDIMSQEVVSIGPEASISEAAQLMLKEHISGLPVIAKDRTLIGIVTEGDLLRRTESGTEKSRPRWLEFIVGPTVLAQEYAHTHGRKVAEVMTRNVATVTEDTAVDRAVELMERYRVKRLPVMRGSKVVGIVSRANFLHALVMVPLTGGATPDDGRIREQIEKELSKQPWNPVQGHVVVNKGVVDIWGVVSHEAHRDAIHVAVENVPGVKKVRDHMIWVEPFSGMTLGAGLDAEKDLPLRS